MGIERALSGQQAGDGRATGGRRAGDERGEMYKKCLYFKYCYYV
jgi:hypothetical protein